MNPTLYSPIYFLSMSMLFFVIGVHYLFSRGYYLQEKGNHSLILPIMITIVLILWLGNRPVSGAVFGDTVNYAHEYMNLEPTFLGIDWHKEWLWQWLMSSCKACGFTVSNFFTIVEMGYMTAVLVAVAIILPKNPLLTLLFFWDSLMFYSFGINGLRNGLACNVVLLSFAFMLRGNKITAIVFSLIAFAIHRSTILPMACFLCALTFFKSPKHGIYVWLGSIIFSIIAGSYIMNFITQIEFDERIISYTIGKYSEYQEIRFRWDFLLYSSMPIVFGWYISVRRRMRESWYDVLFNTYCLANAFWVLLIHSSFSNRFAYLSWFMYPLLIAYPLIMIPLWDNQDSKIGFIILAYISFTLIMQYLWGNL